MIRVLIVDDEIQLLRNLTNYLVSFENEFSVTTASSAEEGAELLALREVDVLLTDVRLPGMSGIDLVRHAVTHQPHIRVAVMTAYSSPKTKDAAFNEGALRFIEKPLDLKELRALLLELGHLERGWSGQVEGLDIFDFAQLMLWGRKTKTIRVRCKRKIGTLVFEKGKLMHAGTDNLTGNEAFFEISQWPNGTFNDFVPRKPLDKNVAGSLEFLLMEAAKRRDEKRRAVYQEKSKPDDDKASRASAEPEKLDGYGHRKKPAKEMTKQKAIATDLLDTLQDEIEGLRAAALFGADGLPLMMSNPGDIKVDLLTTQFAMVSQLISKTVSTSDDGSLSEILITQENGWVLVRPIGKAGLNLIIYVDADASLSDLRLTTKNLATEINRAI